MPLSVACAHQISGGEVVVCSEFKWLSIIANRSTAVLWNGFLEIILWLVTVVVIVVVVVCVRFGVVDFITSAGSSQSSLSSMLLLFFAIRLVVYDTGRSKCHVSTICINVNSTRRRLYLMNFQLQTRMSQFVVSDQLNEPAYFPHNARVHSAWVCELGWQTQNSRRFVCKRLNRP